MTNIVFAIQIVRAKSLIDELSHNSASTGYIESTIYEYENRISEYENELCNYENLVNEYRNSLKEVQNNYELLLEEKNSIAELNNLMLHAYNRWNLYEERYPRADRSSSVRDQSITDNSRALRMRVTAYTEYECDKEPGHPLFGITASGNMVEEWFTVAAGREIPFGTRLYIPYFKDRINNGIFVVEDRGGAIKENCIDVYMTDQDAVNTFGCRWLDVYMLD